eukprot:11175003-Lingulodinium_polyedra.AAC.1
MSKGGPSREHHSPPKQGCSSCGETGHTTNRSSRSPLGAVTASAGCAQPTEQMRLSGTSP